MSQQAQYELQVKAELSESFLIEDDEYSVTYYISNIGENDFPAGATFECRLKYPHWADSYAVMHKWWGASLEKIDIGCTLTLPTNKIKAVAGPNAIIFYQLKLTGQNDCKVVDINHNVLGGGSFVEYYKVFSFEELNSMENLRIAVSALRYALYSFIIMGGIALIDLILQLRFNDIWSLPDVLYYSFLLASLAVILILLTRARYNLKLHETTREEREEIVEFIRARARRQRH